MENPVPTTATVVEEPQGISFFSIKSGETHYCKLEPTIAAYINSSDMGINASRGQDFGWRLDPVWVKKVREFKKNPNQMSIIKAKLGGQNPTTTQILYYIYGEELATWIEAQEDNENPYEEAYLKAIASGSTVEEAIEKSGMPKALLDYQAAAPGEEDDLSDLIDEVVAEDEPATSEEPVAEEPKTVTREDAPAKSKNTTKQK